jgi:hypothetical protein
MRKFLIAAATLASLFAVATVAQGNSVTSPLGQVQTMTATHSPNKAGKGTSVSINLSIECTPATNQCQAAPAPPGKASPVTNTVVHLPKGMKFGYKAFAKCNPAKLQSRGISGCPKKSKVGAGNLTADGRPVVETPVTGSVTAFNGTYSGGKPRYLLYVIPELSSPIVLVGKLRGTTLTIPVPLIPTLPGQPNATLTKFFIKTGGKAKKGKKKINYLTNPKKCPAGGYPWKFDFTYENGESLSPTDKAPCKK